MTNQSESDQVYHDIFQRVHSSLFFPVYAERSPKRTVHHGLEVSADQKLLGALDELGNCNTIVNNTRKIKEDEKFPTCLQLLYSRDALKGWNKLLKSVKGPLYQDLLLAIRRALKDRFPLVSFGTLDHAKRKKSQFLSHVDKLMISWFGDKKTAAVQMRRYTTNLQKAVDRKNITDRKKRAEAARHRAYEHFRSILCKHQFAKHHCTITYGYIRTHVQPIARQKFVPIKQPSPLSAVVNSEYVVDGLAKHNSDVLFVLNLLFDGPQQAIFPKGLTGIVMDYYDATRGYSSVVGTGRFATEAEEKAEKDNVDEKVWVIIK